MFIPDQDTGPPSTSKQWVREEERIAELVLFHIFSQKKKLNKIIQWEK